MASVDRQTTKFEVLQGTAGQVLAGYPYYNQGPASGNTGTGAGTTFNGDGLTALMIQIQELNIGTATVQLRGSFDGATWYPVGYYQVNNNATLARAVADVAVTQASNNVYQILDAYPLYQANISANSGSIYVSAYGIPI